MTIDIGEGGAANADLQRLKYPDSVQPLGEKKLSSAEKTKQAAPTPDGIPAKPIKAAKKAATPKVSGGGFKLLSGDKGRAAGVYFVPEEDDDGTGKKWLCGELAVVAQVRDLDSAGWSVMVRLVDMDGCEKKHLIPRSRLLSDQSTKVLEELADLGLQCSFSQDCKRLLLQYLQTGTDAERARLIPTTGWYKTAFVLPDEVIGDAGEKLIYSGSLKVPVCSLGELPHWKEGVARYAVANPLLLLTLGAGFAAPLMEMAGLDTGGFHIDGGSKKGKSTICDMAASIYGKPTDYRQTWSGTATGIEYTTAGFNHLPLLLDEISQADPKAVDKLVYMLSQGRGKARGRDTGGLRDATRWKCFILSNGEHDLETYIKKGGGQMNAGQAVRFIGLDLVRPFGAFDVLHGFADVSALCESLATCAAQHHGTIGRAYLARLAEAGRAAMIDLIRQAVERFTFECVPSGASGQVRHAAQYFALCGYAAELANSYGLTGWAMGEAWQGAKTVFADWLHKRGGAGDEEDQQILRQVRYWFQQHGDARTQRWDHEVNAVVDTHTAKTLGKCGFNKTITKTLGIEEQGATVSEQVFYIYAEAWKNDVLAGLNIKRANQMLLDKGILIGDGRGRPYKKMRVPNCGDVVPNMYLVSSAVFGGGDD
ncbi:MAG: DUF927 domain-containing protein [Proteobacteria bacterium]|nr:DUF927 domain-containing protein [Pseudomonadota bacterium]